MAMTTSTEPLVVTAGLDSRLSQLHAEYAGAKAAADAATARLKGITDGIKAELNSMAPDERRVQLVTEGIPALQMTYAERWTVDAKRLKTEAPETYVRYAKKSGAWTLRTVAGGGQ
jgi:IMP cyclohydrolase